MSLETTAASSRSRMPTTTPTSSRNHPYLFIEEYSEEISGKKSKKKKLTSSGAGTRGTRARRSRSAR
jgi:hypothetical protein